MLRPAPSTTVLSSSVVAPAALSRLQSLEKHLKNEDFSFSGEIVQCLEDTIAAIMKLEDIRRHTLECLEEETIKNSNLRFRIQNFSGENIKEMTALITAARESSAAKIHQLLSALESIGYKTELLTEKQALCERQNAELCKEQECLQTQHKERVDLLNERVATKVNTNALLTETCDETREKEKEIIRTKAALAELKEKIAEKMSKLEKKKEEYDKENKEMKKFLESQEAKTSQKKHEFENLNVKSSDLKHLISLNSTTVLDEEIALEKLREESKQLEKNLEFRKTDMFALLEQKIQLESELLLLQSKIAQEKEDFNKELEKTKEDLCNAKCLNKNLKLENEAARQKYEQVLEEQQLQTIERDEVVAKSEEYSFLLKKKFKLLENLAMKKKHLEKKTENLEDSLLNIKKSHAEQLAPLEQDLKAENKMRVIFQWKLLYLAMQREVFFSAEESRSRKVNERIEAGKKRHVELLAETENLEGEIFQFENQFKALSEEASKKENDYKNYNEDFANKIKCLERQMKRQELLWMEMNDIKNATENLLKKEQELNTSKLTLEEAQRESEEKHTKYEDLNKSFLEKKDEEVRAIRAIQQSINTTGKLKKDMLELKNKLRMKRDAAVSQLKNHTETMKLLERDIYEINRKIDIVHTENSRFKLRTAQMKEDIFAMNSEAEKHKSAIGKILMDIPVLHDHLQKGWSEERFTQKEFLEDEQELLNAVTALTTEIQQRDKKIGDINTRLQNKLEGLDSLLVQKSELDDHNKID